MTDAITTPNQSIALQGRTLAYRSFGRGRPIVLCTRFRGNMDVWDPAFLDALAANGFRVITFDYSGLGLSTGEKTYNPFEMVRDPRDLIAALDLKDVVIAGWSIGGLVAQVLLTMFPQRLTHAVLLATSPPGPLVKEAEQLFYDKAKLPGEELERDVILFFEPRSEASRAAARRSAERVARREEKSVPVPWEWAARQLGERPKSSAFPATPVLEALQRGRIPVLHVGGDHDIIFPVENWYALNQKLPSLQLLTFPQAGHGPHLQYPQAAAEYIATFARTTP